MGQVIVSIDHYNLGVSHSTTQEMSQEKLRHLEAVASMDPNLKVKKLGEIRRPTRKLSEVLKELSVTVITVDKDGEFGEATFKVSFSSASLLWDELKAAYTEYDKMVSAGERIVDFCIAIGDLQVTKTGHLVDPDGNQVTDPTDIAA